jgi:hypothetical protein
MRNQRHPARWPHDANDSHRLESRVTQHGWLDNNVEDAINFV